MSTSARRAALSRVLVTPPDHSWLILGVAGAADSLDRKPALHRQENAQENVFVCQNFSCRVAGASHTCGHLLARSGGHSNGVNLLVLETVSSITNHARHEPAHVHCCPRDSSRHCSPP